MKLSNQIRMLLILWNFYDKDMPSWPEIMGIYGINLPKRGYKIHWIMPYKIGIFNKIEVKHFRNVKIYLIPFTKNPYFLIKTFSYMVYTLRLTLFLLKSVSKKKYDLIQVRDDAIAGFISIIMKFIYKIKFSFNYSFPFYQADLEAYENGIVSLSSLVYRKIMDIIIIKFVLRHADLIFPISQEMITSLEKKGIDKNKMYPIHLGIDLDIFMVENEKKSNFFRKISIDNDEFVYIYVGAITHIRGLHIIIKAFEILLNNVNKAKLLFIGDGDALNHLKRLSKDLGLEENIFFTGKVSYWDVPSYIDLADVGLSLFFPRKSYYVSSPNKLYEYFAIKKPVIANIEIPEHERIIKKSQGGVLTEYKEDEIAEAMLYMIKYKEKLHSMGEKGYKWVKENRTFKQMAEKLENIYFKLLNSEYSHQD